MWNFVEYIKNVHAPKDHVESEPVDFGCEGKSTIDFYRSRIDPYGIRVVCPCFPDPYSRTETHDYCSRWALFDGCPNHIVLKEDGAYD